MKVTREFLKEKRACSPDYEWWLKYCEGLDNDAQIRKLAKKDYSWANWLLVRIMTYKQYVSYAVFAAKQVIDIYEKKYPNDKRPRVAIKAAKKCIKNPTKKNKAAADAAAAAAAYAAASYAAYAASYAAYAAASYSAASYAAYAAAYAADAADAADDAAYAADAADDAAYAADAHKEMQTKILNYGLKLIKERL